MKLTIRAAESADHPALVEFFESAGSGCFCHYHEFVGDARAFQYSLATDAASHAVALREKLLHGSFHALVAWQGTRIVGFLRFGPPESNKQMTQRIYRDLPCFSGPRRRTASVYCMLVLPELRRRGIAAALVEALEGGARALGYDEIEALPRGTTGGMDEEYWTGPLGLFEKREFTTVHDFAPYPVVRRMVGRED